MILDVALDEDDVREIRQIIQLNNEVNDYHYLKTRRSGKFKFVEVHLVFTPFVKLIDAHNAADVIIADIKKIDIHSAWIVNIHLDPYDDSAEHKTSCKVYFGKK
jgi:divalent metal cation (Fe/Co/Zn/Cd) transporter